MPREPGRTGAGQASNTAQVNATLKHLIGADTQYTGPDGQTRYRVTISLAQLRTTFGLPADASNDAIVAAYNTPQGRAAWDTLAAQSQNENQQLAQEASQASFFDTVGAFFSALGNPATWMRVVFFLIGLAGLIIGALMLNRNLVGNVVSKLSGGLASG